MKTDAQLQHDVAEELKWHATVNAAHIGVSAQDGIVTLSGNVPTYVEKVEAERAAARVAGVRAVADELHVHLTGTSKKNDEDIATACLSALASNYAVPANVLKLLVRDGWVTLMGTLEWQYQKVAAEGALRSVVGICGITNEVVVTPGASTQPEPRQ